MSDRTPVVIVAGGDTVPSGIADRLPSPAFVIAADSGLHSANALGLSVDLIVGDLDSVDPDAVSAARAAGIDVEDHPEDKDATDLELAMEAANQRGLGPAIILGGASFDRIDHFIANALLIAADRFAPLQPTWWVKDASVHVVRDDMTIEGEPDDVVTLLPIGGAAVGVSTTGLRWPLLDDRLDPGTTRGVSNRLVAHRATVSVTAGVLIAIHGGPE